MGTFKLGQILAFFMNFVPLLIRGQLRAMEGNIVGGEYGKIEDFPHAVCINAFCSPKRKSYWVCGASVLNQRILITAAHCIDECNHLHEIYAKAGHSNVKQAQVTRLVVRHKIHEHFDKLTLFYDIALLFVNGDLPLGRTIKRTIIRFNFPTTSEGITAGWGVVNEQHQPTVKLKYVRQRLWQPSKCAKFNDLMPGTFCASSGSHRHYPFAGDSGSGLVAKNGQLIGLVSFRMEEKPEVTFYTNVSYFYYWLKDESRNMYCNRK